jgi:thymidine kinase
MPETRILDFEERFINYTGNQRNLDSPSHMAKLYFYYSAMNAGKTTTLLQSSHNYRERGMRTLLFMAAFDNRYGETGKIISRIGLESEAVTFDEDFSFYEYVAAEHARTPLHCILVDEAHFMTTEHVYQLTDIVDKLHIPVLAYGLRTDFRGTPFEPSKLLRRNQNNLPLWKKSDHEFTY